MEHRPRSSAPSPYNAPVVNDPRERGETPRGPLWVRSRAQLPTEFGPFEVIAFGNELDGLEHIALVHGLIQQQLAGQVTQVRMHSECLTGDVLGSLRCDCRAQLHHSLSVLAKAEPGVLLYLRQEGRGIGLTNKIAAYALQDRGYDTVEANEELGFEADLRDYRVGAEMLKALGVVAVDLHTNNPRKVFGLKQSGIGVVARTAIHVGRRPENAVYLDTKRDRCGHLL